MNKINLDMLLAFTNTTNECHKLGLIIECGCDFDLKLLFYRGHSGVYSPSANNIYHVHWRLHTNKILTSCIRWRTHNKKMLTNRVYWRTHQQNIDLTLFSETMVGIVKTIARMRPLRGNRCKQFFSKFKKIKIVVIKYNILFFK